MFIINVIKLYKAEINPIENIIIPMTKLRSIIFPNFYTVEINVDNNILRY
jgi:hypothetical protein